MRVTGLLTMVCLLCQAAVTLAQSGDAPVSAETRAEASAHFNRGVELFQEEAYRGALVEFQRAYEIAPDYRLLYNIGQTRLAIQDYLGASKAYESYLVRGGASIPNERRVQVEEALAAMKERIGRISITVSRDAAEIYVDEEVVGTSPLNETVMVNVGSHRISARTSDGATDAKTVDVAGGDVAVVALKLVAAAPALVYREEDTSWSEKRRAGFGSWIAGGALIVTGVATGVTAGKAKDDLDKMLKTPEVNQREVEDQRQKAHRLAITTDVLLATGAATAVVGTFLWIYGKKEKAPPGEKKEEARTRQLYLDVGLASLGVRGKF